MMDFHEHAHKYIDVPFKHHGRSTRGMDCVGLIILTARDGGYDSYIEFAYGREPRNSKLQAVLKEHLGPPLHRPPQINDVVLMRLRRAKRPSHVGIITHHPSGLGIIHCYGEIRKVVYQLFSDTIAGQVMGVYACPPAQS